MLPLAREYMTAGNVQRASVYFDAARKVGSYDGALERDIEAALDLSVLHRRQAVEIEVAAQERAKKPS